MVITTAIRLRRAALSMYVRASERKMPRAMKWSPVASLANGASEIVRGMPLKPAVSAIEPKGMI